MNVSSVKNLNGSVFSAVQDAELTEVVQTNSASWGASTIPTDLSANHITANSGFKIGNLAYGEYGYEGYGMNFDRNGGSITIMPNTAQGGGGDYGNINLTSKSGFLGSVATAECSINAFYWNKVNDASNTVVSNSASWSQAGGNPEVESYVQTNSGTIDDTVTAYQTNSSTYLTAHQAISAGEWNDCYNNVNTNSGVWGGSALPVSAGPGIKVNLIDNTLLFSNDETVLWSGARTSAIQTSESMKNFDKCQVYIAHGTYGPPQVYTLDFADMSTTGYFAITRPRGSSNLNIAFIRLTADNTHLAAVNAKCLAFGSWSTTATGVTATTGEAEDLNSIIKVVGINRINGGN